MGALTQYQRGGLGLSMEGLKGGEGAEETRKGGTEAFGQIRFKSESTFTFLHQNFLQFLFMCLVLDRGSVEPKVLAMEI